MRRVNDNDMGVHDELRTLLLRRKLFCYLRNILSSNAVHIAGGRHTIEDGSQYLFADTISLMEVFTRRQFLSLTSIKNHLAL